MAIHTHEEVVTRLDRRMRSRAKLRNSTIRRERLREKQARKHLTDAGVAEFSHKELDDARAHIKALELKRSQKLPSKMALKLSEELEAITRRKIDLAHKVTNYIRMSRNCIVWGESLKDIYLEIAEALNRSADDVEEAVGIAEAEGHLYRKEADDFSKTECVCINPAA